MSPLVKGVVHSMHLDNSSTTWNYTRVIATFTSEVHIHERNCRKNNCDSYLSKRTVWILCETNRLSPHPGFHQPTQYLASHAVREEGNTTPLKTTAWKATQYCAVNSFVMFLFKYDLPVGGKSLNVTWMECTRRWLHGLINSSMICWTGIWNFPNWYRNHDWNNINCPKLITPGVVI